MAGAGTLHPTPSYCRFHPIAQTHGTGGTVTELPLELHCGAGGLPTVCPELSEKSSSSGSQ